jgi:hypothetical protein
MKMPFETFIGLEEVNRLIQGIGWHKKGFNRKARFGWLGTNRLVINFGIFELIRLCGCPFPLRNYFQYDHF